jgi:hypothetical protein
MLRKAVLPHALGDCVQRRVFKMNTEEKNKITRDIQGVERKIEALIKKRDDDLGCELMNALLVATNNVQFSDEAWSIAKHFFKRAVFRDTNDYNSQFISADSFLLGLREYDRKNFFTHFDDIPLLAGWVLFAKLFEHFLGRNKGNDYIYFWCDIVGSRFPNEFHYDCRIHGAYLTRFGRDFVVGGSLRHIADTRNCYPI